MANRPFRKHLNTPLDASFLSRRFILFLPSRFHFWISTFILIYLNSTEADGLTSKTLSLPDALFIALNVLTQCKKYRVSEIESER